MYNKAAVSALLDQCLSSTNPDYAPRYYAAAGKLVEHALRPGEGEDDEGEDSQLSEWRVVEGYRRSADAGLLELLQYRVMDKRKADITETFAESYQWIFNEPLGDGWTNLPRWLSSGEDIYLIVGNEGSGKSTMMKYILTREDTLEHLKQWAGPIPLLTVAFFFWRNGTRLEKSEEGLWRTVLHSALDQQPHLMPVVFPAEWARLYLSASSENAELNLGLGAWDVKNLREAFHRLVTQTQLPLKLFILIDGIDEHVHESGEDRFAEIIQFLGTEISESNNAKALISSRPLDALEQSGIHPGMIVHDLNRADIENYVRTSLEREEAFQQSQTSDNDNCELVIAYILDESNGVFLWAVLSVKILVSKLSAGATIAEIAQDLENTLKPALQDLYVDIWNGMNQEARLQASQILQIVLVGEDTRRRWLDNNEETLQLIDIALALGHPDDTIKASITPWHLARSSVEDRCDSAAAGFMKTWPGFIMTTGNQRGERHWSPASRIRYCHRSVPEFFRKNHRSLLRPLTQELGYFNPRVALVKSFVHQLKILPKPLPNEPLQVLWMFATTALLVANRIEDGVHSHDSKRADRNSGDNTMNPHGESTDDDPGGSAEGGAEEGTQEGAEHDADEGAENHRDNNPDHDHNEASLVDMRNSHNLLDELDKVMGQHHEKLQKDADGKYLRTVIRDHRGTVAFEDGGRDSRLRAAMHWSNFHPDTEHAHPRGWDDSFLSLAVQFGLHNYVKSKLGDKGSTKVVKSKKGRPLLDYALQPLMLAAPHGLVVPEMVRTLIDHGANPNEKFEGRTCWEGALHWQYEVFYWGKAQLIFAAGGTTEDAKNIAKARAEIIDILIDEKAEIGVSLTIKGLPIPIKQGVENAFTGWIGETDIKDLTNKLPRVQSGSQGLRHRLRI